MDAHTTKRSVLGLNILRRSEPFSAENDISPEDLVHERVQRVTKRIRERRMDGSLGHIFVECILDILCASLGTTMESVERAALETMEIDHPLRGDVRARFLLDLFCALWNVRGRVATEIADFGDEDVMHVLWHVTLFADGFSPELFCPESVLSTAVQVLSTQGICFRFSREQLSGCLLPGDDADDVLFHLLCASFPDLPDGICESAVGRAYMLREISWAAEDGRAPTFANAGIWRI